MLKLLYKTLLVSVLSGSLLLLDFSYKGAILNSAMAETVKTDKIKDSDLMGTLTMTVVGVLAKRLYAYKPTTDVMIAAAAGTIFIAGEILAFVKLKDVMKGMEQEITRDKDGNVNAEQIKSLERLKKSYEEAKKTANTKKMLQMAAAAAFAAAAVVAYTSAAADLAALTTCTTGVNTALSTVSGAVTATCASLSSNYVTAAEGAACYAEVASCTSSITAYEGALMSYEMGRQAPGPSLPGLTKATTTGKALTAQLSGLTGTCGPQFTSAAAGALQGACQGLVPLNDTNATGGQMVGADTANNSIKNLPEIYKKLLKDNGVSEQRFVQIMSEQTQKKSDSFFEKALDLFFPKANAALFSAMGIASSLAISFILATSATLGPSIDMFMLIPQKRAIVWGILGALTAASTMATNNVISQIEANIKKIDDILKSLNTMSAGATGTQTETVAASATTSTIKPTVSTAANAVNYEAVDLSNSVDGKLPCDTGSDSTGKCKSNDDGLKDLPSYNSLDTASQLQLSSILKTANGLNGTSTISKGTLSGASSLAASSNAINSALTKAKDKAAAALKAAGSKTDLDKESKALAATIEKAVNDNLKKSGTTASGMYASLSGGAGSSGTATDASKAAADTSLAKGKSGFANAVNLNAGSSEKTDLGLTGVDTGTKTMSAEELAAYNAANKGKADIDDYELKNDISTDTGANIFELISNRYQQSGYPRLFKLKEPAPAAAEAVKN